MTITFTDEQALIALDAAIETLPGWEGYAACFDVTQQLRLVPTQRNLCHVGAALARLHRKQLIETKGGKPTMWTITATGDTLLYQLEHGTAA